MSCIIDPLSCPIYYDLGCVCHCDDARISIPIPEGNYVALVSWLNANRVINVSFLGNIATIDTSEIPIGEVLFQLYDNSDNIVTATIDGIDYTTFKLTTTICLH